MQGHAIRRFLAPQGLSLDIGNREIARLASHINQKPLANRYTENETLSPKEVLYMALTQSII